MTIGDWPAWIALTTSILSPVITIYLNHRFKLKMQRLAEEAKKQETISLFIGEITSIAASTPDIKRPELSVEALRVVRYCDKNTAQAIIRLVSCLNDEFVLYTSHRNLYGKLKPYSEAPAHIFENPNKPGTLCDDTVSSALIKLAAILNTDHISTRRSR